MMWDHRCKILHTRDLTNKVRDMIAIDNRISEVCQRPPHNILPHESSLFHHTVESLSLHTPRYRRIWLQRAEKVIQSCAKRDQQCKQLHSEQNLMRRWLGLTQYKQTLTQTNISYSGAIEDADQIDEMAQTYKYGVVKIACIYETPTNTTNAYNPHSC